MEPNQLFNRDTYLKRLIAFRDTEMIKVITGIRRCGKSSLLKLMVRHLLASGVDSGQIIEINFESMSFYSMSSEQLYDYVKLRVLPKRKMYLFLDEVQMIKQWQTAVNAFRIDFDCDIYITGSNAHLLSSELSTYLSGRYIEIRMLPLSFREFLDFTGYTVEKVQTPLGEANRVFRLDGVPSDRRELFNAYLKYGGMPAVAGAGFHQENIITILDGIYSAVVMRDILERGKEKQQRLIADPVLLRKLIMFLADNIGNNTSATSVANTLVAEGLIDGKDRKSKPATQTIQAYIQALIEAYIFYEIKRYDIKGKELLRTLGKYYIVDIGLRNYLLGYRDVDRGHILENVVYFELLRRGYDLSVGKVYEKEVDFIATKADEKKYYQVTESIIAPDTRERETSALMSIKDNYEKIILTNDNDIIPSQQGLKIVQVIDFLLDN